jgi:hypothetical protein
MSFNIFVSGNAGTYENPRMFNYKKKDQPDDDSFDLMIITSKLMSMVDPKTAAMVVADIPMPNVYEAVQGIGRMVSLKDLNDSLTFLTMHAGAYGSIMVSCEEENLLWTNTVKLAIYNLSPKVRNPGADFITRIAPVLKETGLDTYGVLQEMSQAIYKYQKQVSKSLGVRLNIYLTKT